MAERATAGEARIAVSRTPLRVSLFGGGTDLPGYYRRHGGQVLSFAIDQYVRVAVQRSWTGELTIRCEDTQRAGTVDEVAHPIVRAALRRAGVPGGVEMVSMSDIPPTGSGLGSSSAFTVGLLNALHGITGRRLSAAELAEMACRVEIEDLAEPIGKQDQYAVALGGCHQFTFHPDDAVTADPVALSADCAGELARHVLVVHTGRFRRAREVLTHQQARIGVTETELGELKALVPDGRQCLDHADMAGLGALLHTGWEIKKKLSALVHDTALDDVYRAARRAGAYGGKLLGAGGGGFFLFLCPPEQRPAVRATLAGLRELPIRLGVPGTRLMIDRPRHDGEAPC